MELVNTIWSLLSSSWGCISHHIYYLRDLDEKLSSLKDAMDELKGISEDISRKVTLVEKNPCMESRQEVKDWLRKVGDVEKKVNQIVQKGHEVIQKRCLARCCPRTCKSSYKLGKEGVKYLGIVNEMKDKGRFDVVGIEVPLFSSSGGEQKAEGLREIPMDEKVVGMESAFDFAWGCLYDDRFRIIGLYGMGGVGKTTLLKKINNELFQSNNRDFDLVIWIIASKQGKVGTIQDSILRKLNVPIKSWRNYDEQEKAGLIHYSLQKRKFILMLDDLWEFLDLVRVGIPLSQTRLQKLVFTTRSEKVCAEMGADERIKVTCLPRDAAWSLFHEKVGEATLNSHPEIPKLARLVATECDGLPLALITIGRAMASMKKPYEWERAIRMLKTYPSKFEGMAEHVLPVLKFSYDSLKDEIVKKCFLYCSIFPEDHEIMNHDLVDLWIGEGYVKDLGGLYEARNDGLCIIETLKRACLLEEGQSEVLVKMHGVIRDMALWIACECGLKSNQFLVQEQLNSTEPHGVVEGRQEVEKLSLWGNDHVEKALESARYPHLNTCLIRGASFTGLPRSFFQLASVIRVLDLSENRNLNKLPDAIGHLRTLQYLSISKTQVKCLPKELKNVTGLRYLLLDFMTCLEDIPPEIISSFSDLRIF